MNMICDMFINAMHIELSTTNFISTLAYSRQIAINANFSTQHCGISFRRSPWCLLGGGRFEATSFPLNIQPANQG